MFALGLGIRRRSTFGQLVERNTKNKEVNDGDFTNLALVRNC